ncbi:Glycoprotein GP40/15 [Cryptosporidium canis]|nr:Glycoprotein GP40/15 [Cryptosporidium canis]
MYFDGKRGGFPVVGEPCGPFTVLYAPNPDGSEPLPRYVDGPDPEVTFDGDSVNVNGKPYSGLPFVPRRLTHSLLMDGVGSGAVGTGSGSNSRSGVARIGRSLMEGVYFDPKSGATSSVSSSNMRPAGLARSRRSLREVASREMESTTASDSTSTTSTPTSAPTTTATSTSTVTTATVSYTDLFSFRLRDGKVINVGVENSPDANKRNSYSLSKDGKVFYTGANSGNKDGVFKLDENGDILDSQGQIVLYDVKSSAFGIRYVIPSLIAVFVTFLML